MFSKSCGIADTGDASQREAELITSKSRMSYTRQQPGKHARATPTVGGPPGFVCSSIDSLRSWA